MQTPESVVGVERVEDVHTRIITEIADNLKTAGVPVKQHELSPVLEQPVLVPPGELVGEVVDGRSFSQSGPSGLRRFIEDLRNTYNGWTGRPGTTKSINFLRRKLGMLKDMPNQEVTLK